MLFEFLQIEVETKNYISHGLWLYQFLETNDSNDHHIHMVIYLNSSHANLEKYM